MKYFTEQSPKRQPMTIKIETIDKIQEAAKIIIAETGNDALLSFEGKMGAGKTTLIKAICEELKVIDAVNSPTFSIVNEYQTINGKIIYHFDFYRIEKIQEALDFGIEDYFYSGNLCLMEWAENITPILPPEIITITISETENGSRIIEIKK